MVNCLIQFPSKYVTAGLTDVLPLSETLPVHLFSRRQLRRLTVVFHLYQADPDIAIESYTFRFSARRLGTDDDADGQAPVFAVLYGAGTETVYFALSFDGQWRARRGRFAYLY